ncbi:MAG: extracellular solute-binding protein [Chloroflexota bacterium]
MLNTLSRRTLVGSLAFTPILAACGGAPPGSTQLANGLEKDLVLYSARKEELFTPTLKLFEQKTGVKVTVKSGATGELALLIEQEKTSPRGDIYFTTDAGDANSLRERTLLDPYKSTGADKIPAEFKAPDGTWTGVIGRSRNILANTNVLTAADMPRSVLELTSARWKDKVAIASIREGGVRLWLASLIATRGEDFAVKFVSDLKSNGLKVLANHTEVTNAVVRGELPLGLTNHYYYVAKKREGAPVHLIYPDQGTGEMGTLVTPLAVSIIRGARNPKAARAFVDFLLSPEGVQPMTAQEQEFPLTPGTPLGDAAVSGVKPISEIKRPSVDFVKVAGAQKRAVDIFTPLLTG